MEILRKSFVEILERCETQSMPVALAAWDSWVDWCSSLWLETPARTSAKSWIASQNAVGGNDMRYAIEEAMRRFPDVDDVYIVCDGDVSPFSVPGGNTSSVNSDVPQPSSRKDESRGAYYSGTSWEAFRLRFPKVKFHFIALGSGSSKLEMQR